MPPDPPSHESVLPYGNMDGRRSRSTRTRGALLDAVDEVLADGRRPVRLVVAQALAKGDRAELAVEMLTEVGVDEVAPWQASRSVARWSADRVERGLARWRSTAREAAKQSRRLRVPEVSAPVGTTALAARLGAADLALVLHEDATEPIAARLLSLMVQRA